MREWAPPFPILSSPTPPRHYGQKQGMGGDEAGVNANHSYLQWHKGTGKNGEAGEISPQAVLKPSLTGKTQRKPAPMLGLCGSITYDK